MRLVVILAAIFIFLQSCHNCDCPPFVPVSNPKPGKEGKAKQIMVSIDKNQEFYIGTNKVERSVFDSLLIKEIRLHQALIDTPVVVINADTAAHYGVIFTIMKTARKGGAKVVARVED